MLCFGNGRDQGFFLFFIRKTSKNHLPVLVRQWSNKIKGFSICRKKYKIPTNAFAEKLEKAEILEIKSCFFLNTK